MLGEDGLTFFSLLSLSIVVKYLRFETFAKSLAQAELYEHFKNNGDTLKIKISIHSERQKEIHLVHHCLIYNFHEFQFPLGAAQMLQNLPRLARKQVFLMTLRYGRFPKINKYRREIEREKTFNI